MSKAYRLLAVLLAAVTLTLCARDLALRGRAATSEERGMALGVHAPDRSTDLESEARTALARDARRREERFRDAAEPGRLRRSSRVSQEAIDRAWSEERCPGPACELSPAHLYELGAQLFHHLFLREEGFGDRDQALLVRVERGARGGPDARRCSDCHRRGGPAGAGDAVDNAHLDGDGDTPASGLERNPIALSGAGIVELLGREMSVELAARARALGNEAREAGEKRRVALAAKGVSFGFLSAEADGRLDVSEVRGVDADLVVKPFGHKGHEHSLRDIIEDELLLHHGMQSSHLAQHGKPERVGAFPLPDPDGDGVVDEIAEGEVTALTAFVAMQELPHIELPRESSLVTRWAQGQARFVALGCAGCHTPSLPLDSTVYELASRDGKARLRIDLSRQGAAPRIARAADGRVHVFLFSDLRRHVMGPLLREARGYRGVSAAEFLTRPLWGLARSAPYLHDGRSATLDHAILQHGGEADEARRRYEKLSDEERAPLRIYLTSLTRMPRMMVP
jgi:cytochrome c peroxidase